MSQEKIVLYLKYILLTIVPREGLEPPRAYTHQILSQARLPIPPPRQFYPNSIKQSYSNPN